MDVEHHPTDVLVEDIVGIYKDATRRLGLIVAAGLRRGLDPSRAGGPGRQRGDATLAYRARQLAQARQILAELERQGRVLGPIVVGRAYGAAMGATDELVTPGAAPARLRGAFGGVHVRAVEALAANLAESLRLATQRAGVNVSMVFERANAIDGALGGDGRVAGVPFLGRRADDPYRRLGLQTIGQGLVALDTRRQISAELGRRLVSEGVTDATTGYVDRRGRRWPLHVYSEMAVRTTAREAATAATVNRLVENGLDLVTVSRHEHVADECTPFEGRTFSISGRDRRYPPLVESPPFHPRCVHVLGPASASLDDFEAELERRARDAAVS